MLNKLKVIYRSEMFDPGFIGLFVNPFYFARKGLRASILKMSPELSGDLLDVGCGRMPYRSIFKVRSYRGLEIDSPDNPNGDLADDLYDGYKFPYEDQKYDSVLCNQVLEHIFNPDEFLQEINRVLKINGQLLLTVPFVWDEHEQPYDFARYSSFGLKSLLEKNGFIIIKHEKIGCDATILFQLTNAYLFKVTKSWPKLINFLFTVLVIGPINLFGLFIGKVMPSNQDLYLDNAVLAKKIL